MGHPAIDIDALSREERMDLIDRLWTSFERDGWELTPEQQSELERRLDRLHREGPNGISLEEMMARLDSRGS